VAENSEGKGSGKMTEKSTGELIVEMICSGRTSKEIEADLDITTNTLKVLFEKIRRNAGLPWDKRTYKARKDDIFKNIEKWKAYKLEADKAEKTYRSSLIQFDF
jgi:hypothetical protein